METLDLIIIGAGPAGIAAAVEGRRGELQKILILEKGDSHNQMIRTYYKEGKRVDARYAGLEAICFGVLCLRDGNRESYIALMDHVIESYKLEIRYKTEVWGILRDPTTNLFEVKIAGGASVFSKSVVIAIGKMGRPNQPDYYKEVPASLKNAKKLLFDITSRPLEGQKILVVGGGDTASEYCDILGHTNEITLSYRRAEFTKMNPMNEKILTGLLASGKVRALMPTNIVGVADDNGRCLVSFKEATQKPEHFDAIVYALGGMNPVEFLKSSQIKVNERGEPLVDTNHESSVQGLYIVGDLLGKTGGGGSIIAGFNSSAEAVRHLLLKTFNKVLEPEAVSLDHLKF